MMMPSACSMTARCSHGFAKRTDVETGERKRFASAILLAWARKSPQVAEVLPLLYLHGLSSGDFARSHCGLRSITMRVTVVTVAASWL